MSQLFTPFTLRGVTLRNRIGISPMCMYSSTDGFANDWHLMHLGARAAGGAALVIAEATSVTPEGRITGNDLGIWSDDHVPGLQRVAQFVRDQGAVPAIQLAHAGRKAGTKRPWDRPNQVPFHEGGWEPIGPSPVAFNERLRQPREMTRDDIRNLIDAFAAGARRSLEAGFQAVEIHAAHGYLLHQFLSPLSNDRTDEYGGTYENRTRIVREIAVAIRQVWPDDLPLLIRFSATDYVEGGWDLDQTVRLAQELVPLGVDPAGLITEPKQAEAIVAEGQADLVLLARASLRDPHWPLRAAKELGGTVDWPGQYERAQD